MSDAALVGQSGSPPEQVKRESLGHGSNPGNIVQSEAAVPNAAGGASHVTTSGNIVSSDDPSTRPDASATQKLKGDVQGAIKGTVGSVQGAVGAAIRNKDMEQKGLDKMQEEDERLGAKRGVLPVGSERRHVVEDATTGGTHVAK